MWRWRVIVSSTLLSAAANPRREMQLSRSSSIIEIGRGQQAYKVSAR